MDGSFSLANEVMGTSGVMRDSDGEWLWGFSGYHGPGSALLAELLDLKIGLNQAWEANFQRIICESDSLEAIQLLENHIGVVTRVVSCLKLEVSELLSRNWEVRLLHVPHDANMVANYLAKLWNRGSPGVSYWDTPLLELADCPVSDRFS
ncbi:Ribonuclease H-like superfamily [Sesbania bispinosa]|nr:Ribonuclease H-like superfamily [Sesbania bispinosa]